MERFGRNIGIRIAILCILLLIGAYYSGIKLVVGLFVLSIIIGELTRRLFRLFIKPKNNETNEPTEDELEAAADMEAVDFAILWTGILLIMSVL